MAKNSETPRAAEALPSRDRILDAAEELFSLRGYEAATVREITRHAGVPLGLANHYFGTKEDLFREVIGRRAVVHVADMNAALDEAMKDPLSGEPTVEDFIDAYVGPLLRRSASGDPGWKNYCRLLGHTLNSPHYNNFVQRTLSLFDLTYTRFIQSLKRIFPGCDEKGIFWSVYFLHASVIHILVEAGMVDRQSDGLCKSSELDEILAEMIPFYAAAFKSRLGRARPDTVRSPA
ncbi:MAG: TetR/AcrR family transcriptional regulator [Sphingobium sp.]|nr:TetR/AcrR family transcriptional regulator [Sphingobium sp.]